ncbi:Na+/H+ antiporter subunit A [Tenuibacillus multivorans]|uniref:Multicomponent Na+:H+ antiporter subunit A n=1 Tax=Tenuibacillus multivorans TaxID=237069 RepID=A0A1G9ZG61_9BACI|nr:Na+/H+ antiporter subunit A [Tenuibacillus multivorans]GEL77515.1 Na(+)/H(+) antiporter subunit A [Tenuibacillus multivorans]SDN20318.1 multicomponent Na+:H+ antiporter subunit A [Tenuibacillus multivorans]
MVYAVFAPLIFAIIIPFLSRLKHKIHTGWLILPVPLLIFVYFLQFVGSDFKTSIATVDWIPSLNISIDFYLDGLSLLFALLISGIGALVVLYSIYYLDKEEQIGHFYTYLFIFMSSMLGVVLSDNVFVLYTFWEFTSLSSFLLIGYWHYRERSRYGALKSMLITVFGGFSLLGGLILLTIETGTTSIRGMVEQADVIVNSPYFLLILVFLLLGAFTKSAQFPFHIWLPDAMEAPTPVSAYLHSATMVKAGIYLMARFSPIFSEVPIFFILLSLFGLITLAWASYMAVRQTDLKGILAFSTISQLGMIMAMLGFGTSYAVFAAVFHILNHATFKGSLFMIAGIVDHETGSRDIRKLGGLMTFMPMSATLALFGTFSMAGVPLPFLNGFYSKEMFFESSLGLGGYSGSFVEGLVTAIPIIAVVGSIFTFIYSMYLFFGTFRGKYKENELPKEPHEAPFMMLVPPMILVIGVIVIGLFPNFFNQALITHSADAVYGADVTKDIKFWHGWNSRAFQMSLIVVGVGLLLYLTKKKWDSIYNYFPGRLNLNRVYDWIVEKIESASNKITTFYMTGSLRLYITLIVGTIILITAGTILFTNGSDFEISDVSSISAAEVIISIIMAVAAIGASIAKNRIAAILILGVVGYGLSLLFVLYSAPDLALTQLIVETVTVVLFLLCFYHLPNLTKDTSSIVYKGSNIVVSIAYGLLMMVIGMTAYNSRFAETISTYFTDNAYKLGGGDNVVNVILVDFRGIDTLFEIAVLFGAALAVFGLIKLRQDKGAK